jgi:protein-disulfide isomerase
MNLLRAALPALWALVFAIAPHSAWADAPAPLDKKALEQAIHDYLISHPEVVLDALKAAQQKQDEVAAEETRRTILAKQQELTASPEDLVQGNPKGDVTLVEFFDYRCPYCKQVEPALAALLKDDKKLRIVYKEFPVLGEASVFATRVALAAKKQGKYAPFHDAMMGTKGTITDETVLGVAKSVGLDLEKIKADMAAPEIEQLIEKNYALADALKIDGTPAMVVGDRMIAGAVDIDALRSTIAAVRKRS